MINSITQVPSDINNSDVTKRFLARILQQINFLSDKSNVKATSETIATYGFNRLDKTTLPIIEFCGIDTKKYRRIYFDSTDEVVRAVDIDTTGKSYEGYFSDGTTSLKAKTLAMINSNTFNKPPIANDSILGTNGCYYYNNGIKINIEHTSTSTISDSGTYIFYLDALGILSNYLIDNSDRKSLYDIVHNYTVVSILTYNSDSNKLVSMSDNAQSGSIYNIGQTYDIITSNINYGIGLDILGIMSGADTFSNISAGDIFNSSIYMPIAECTSNEFLYRASDGNWMSTDVSNNKLGYTLSSLIQYNPYISGEWKLEDLPDGDYMLVHFVITDDLISPLKKILGERAYGSASMAYDYIDNEIAEINKTVRPTLKFKVLYSLIIDTDGKLLGVIGLYKEHRF